MNFDRGFCKALGLLCLLCLPLAVRSVPLRPETEASLKAKGHFEDARAALRDAEIRGVNQPTPYPVDLKAMRDMDRTDLHVLTILVDFEDNPADTALYPAGHYEELLYSAGTYPTGSLRDYYLENSYGDVHIVGEAVGWYRMPHPYSYYTDGNYGFGGYPYNAQKLTEDAVYAADPDVDFSLYDNDGDGYVDALFVVHAGPGAEQTGSPNDIWSHAWVTYNVPYVDGVRVLSYSQEPDDGVIGVFCHELGHALFGLPDLYDYDYDSYGTGMWSLMSGGVWAGGGVTPVHLDAWSKIEAGFVEPVTVVSDETGVFIPQVETNGIIYRLWTQGDADQQYFLVENRQPVGFDTFLPGGGLLIYHIEEHWGNNSNQWYPGYVNYGHYLVAVEQADGDWDLERYWNSGDAGDPWPGSSGNTSFDLYSTPDSRDYDFAATQVAVRNISPSSEVMTADFEVGIFFPHGREIVLTPEAGGIVLPDEGGSFTYHVEAVNYDSTSVQTDVWFNVILPDGGIFGPLGDPHSVNLPAAGGLEADFTQFVPPRSPSGQYTFVGYIGTYPAVIEDSSFFHFTKGAANGVGNGSFNPDGWTSEGGFEIFRETPPGQFILSSAFPNPFNPVTTIRFELPQAARVTLDVYDVNGRCVATLVEGYRHGGSYEAAFDASDLASGVYVYHLTAGEYTATGKMVLMK